MILEPIGTQFGKWTIEAYAGVNRHQMTMVDARCGSCGEIKTVILANLRAGRSKQCSKCAFAEVRANQRERRPVGQYHRRGPYRLLSADEVVVIKQRLVDTADPYRAIAATYGASPLAIAMIAHNQTWRKIPWPGTPQPRVRGGRRKK